MKVKEKIYNLCSTLRKSTERFPLTIATILVLTVLYTINLDNDFIKQSVLMNITLFAGIFASTNFLIETILENNSKKRILYYGISAIISALFTYLSNIDGDFLRNGKQNFFGKACKIYSVLFNNKRDFINTF